MGARQTTFEGTQPVRERHQVDERRLADWLAAQILDFRGPLVVRQFRGGQSNPTYQLAAGGGRWVLQPPGWVPRARPRQDRRSRAAWREHERAW